jgi:hypothetical protein
MDKRIDPEFFRGLEAALGPAIDIQEQIKEIMAKSWKPQPFPGFEAVQTLAQSVQQDVKAQLQRFQADAQELMDQLRESFRKAPEQARTLGRAGWVLSGDFPFRGLAVAAEVYETEGQEAVDDLFIRFYEHEENLQYNRMRSHLLRHEDLAAWRDVIENCLWAYESGRYSLVIPAALAVIEGVITGLLEQLANQRSLNAHKTWSQHSAQPDSQRVMFVFWCGIDSFLNAIWSSVPFDGSQPPIVNRHWVHHGRWSDLNKKADALRLLAALRAIVENWEFAPRDGAGDQV